MTDEQLLQNYLDKFKLNKNKLTASQIEQVFDSLVVDLLKKKISDLQFSAVCGLLFYGSKAIHEVEGDYPELAGLLTFASEISWDKENKPARYEQTLLNIIHYAKNKFLI